MNPLLELADRVEAATAGSFTLDKEILNALGYTWRGMAYWHRDDKRTWQGGVSPTLSLDSAMTLPPEDMRWCVDTCEGKPRSFVEPRDPGSLKVYVSSASTPALALTAASLRAIASMGSSG